MPTLNTSLLHLAYERRGPATGPVALLLHGFPDDYHTWDHVAIGLLDAGYQVVIPSVRGCGGSVFLHTATMRSGQVVAFAQDYLDLLDGLGLRQPVLVVGHDWGARAGYVLAALWPERVKRLVVLSVGYETSIKPGQELALPQVQAYWYQWFFHSERAAEMLTHNRREFGRYLWHLWSPGWQFTEAELDAADAAWHNPDWVAVVLHSYRVRWGAAPPDPRYEALEARLKPQPIISVPTLLLHGEQDGAALVASSEGKEQYFSGLYERRVLPGVGHFIPREAPEAVVAAVLAG